VPSFSFDSPAENAVFHAGFDAYLRGRLAGEKMVEQAEKLNKDLYVHELWCPMAIEVCALRSKGFNDVVDQTSLVTTVVQSATEGVDEKAYAAITDAFLARPELNAVYNNGGHFDGIRGALSDLDIYYPVGDPNHIVWIAQDDFPIALTEIRAGYLDIATGCGSQARAELCLPGSTGTQEN
jgi:ribose transport system substrate-binding protein